MLLTRHSVRFGSGMPMVTPLPLPLPSVVCLRYTPMAITFFRLLAEVGEGCGQPHNGGASLSCFHSALFWLQRSVHPTPLPPPHFSSLASLYGQLSGLLNSCVPVSSHSYPSYLSWSCRVMRCACKPSIKSALCICVSMGWLLPLTGH